MRVWLREGGCETSAILGTPLVGLLLILMPLAPADTLSRPETHREIPASDLLERLREGPGVDESDVRVTGDVDLRSLGTVERPFRCGACTFSGDFDATDVVVDGIVDLSGSTIEGSLLLAGARVRAPFIFDAVADHISEVRGRTELRLARFSDVVSWEGARLMGPVDAASAQFIEGASFGGVEFLGFATFDRARFGSTTSFAEASTRGLGLARAHFAGAADFRQHRFEDTADFTGVVFDERADFALAAFTQDAQFDTSKFGRDASFRLIAAPYASFRNTQAAGAVVFDGAVLERGGSFAASSLVGALSLRRLQTLADTALELDQVDAPVIRLEVAAIDLVRGAAVREAVLTLLEEDAKAAGDLQLANDARFRRLELQAARNRPFLQRLLDRVVYREIAGYLVRPLYPARAVFLLFLIGLSARVLPTWSRSLRRLRLPMPGRGHSLSEYRDAGGRANFDVFLRALRTSFRQVISRRSGVDWQAEGSLTGRAVARATEFVAHKVLLALFLLSLANSNATWREVIDAVRSGG